MQHPIGEHALLADSRTAALVDPDGNVAWLCWPWIDSTPLLFSILDGVRGGGFSLRPSRPDARVVSRAYHPRSLVLETVWAVGTSQLIVEDALVFGDGPALVRRVRAEGDAIEVVVTITAPDWPGTHADLRVSGSALELRGVCGVVIRAPSPWNSVGTVATSEFTAQPGLAEALTFCTADATAPDPSIDRTIDAWRDAIPASIALLKATIPEPADLFTTAAVVLGLQRRDGGIVAAPTTSLPQWPGSARTWDYRYCWLRDSSLAAMAMLRLGLVSPAMSLGAFIGRVVMESGPVPLVRLDGTAPPREMEIAELAGYGGAHPVRIGNAAAGQAQLDVPGEVIELATSLARQSALPDELAAAVPVLAKWLVARWREPDHGIWEIRGAPARYTHSLITAMSGLEGAASLVDRRLASGNASAWRQAGAAIATTICARGGPLELKLDGGGADASLAHAALLGGLDGIAERIGPTLDLIVARLARGGLVDRYEGQPDTLEDPCAPFVFPTFWLAAALTATGRPGSHWLDTAITTRGSLGLFGEVADPITHSPLGNYPQVQSHAAFVLAGVAPRDGP